MKFSILKQKTAWKEAAWAFGLSRLMIMLTSYVAISRFNVIDFNLPKDIVKHSRTPDIMGFLHSWWRWDVVHYVEIAHNGYNAPNTAFFPLFPLLMRGLGALLGGSAFSDYVAGLVLANLCFYGALVLFYQLVCEDFDQSVARSALFLLTFAPYAIFFFVGYAESLFLLLSLATFSFLRQGRPTDWWLAGFCGFLATLSRPTGVVLIVPFLVIFVQQFGLGTLFRREKWPDKLNALLSMALLPAGILAYMLFLGMNFGNPVIYSTEQARVWGRAFALPWVGLIDTFRAVFISPYLKELILADLFFTLIPLAVLVIGWKRISLQYSLYALAVILVGLSFPRWLAGPGKSLQAAPRYMLIAFPIFLIFALWSKKHHRLNHILAVASIGFFVLNIVLFVTQNWVA